MDGHQFRLTGLAKPAHDRRIDGEIGRCVDHRQLPRASIRPQHELAVGRQNGMEVAVTLDDGDIRAPGANDGEMTRGHIRELVEQRLLVCRNEFRVLQIVPRYFKAPAPVCEPMFARHQDGLDLTLVQGEGTFVFPYEDALASKNLVENSHCLTPVGHGPMRGVKSCVDLPFRFSFYIVSSVMVRARMIRGLVASIHSGPSGADRGAAKRAPEALASLAGNTAP